MEHGILLTQNTLYFTFIFVSTTEYFICSDLSVRKNVLIITGGLWDTPPNSSRLRILAASQHGTLVVGVSQTLRR